jgi:hypothetical protein
MCKWLLRVLIVEAGYADHSANNIVLNTFLYVNQDFNVHLVELGLLIEILKLVVTNDCFCNQEFCISSEQWSTIARHERRELDYDYKMHNVGLLYKLPWSYTRCLDTDLDAGQYYRECLPHHLSLRFIESRD